MNHYLRLLRCLPMLATTACAADAIAGPGLEPEPEALVQALSAPSGQDAASAGASPRATVVLCRLSLSASPAPREPLYIVDGVILTEPPRNLSPSAVESIEVLSGATAAALYGSRAVPGVVIITTRSGAARAAASPRR